MKKVLFVCLGNICRSPAAEAIMKSKLWQLGKERELWWILLERMEDMQVLCPMNVCGNGLDVEVMLWIAVHVFFILQLIFQSLI